MRTAGLYNSGSSPHRELVPRRPNMCFPFDAHPPIAAIAGAAVDSEDLVLQSADGTKFAAFAARAAQPGGAGMVVLPDVRGLFAFYEELALRFAEQGINSVAIDYF